MKPAMLTMDGEWREFSERHFKGLAGKIPQVQYDETKKTFYETFGHVLVKMLDVAKHPEDVGAAQLDAFLVEIKEFLRAEMMRFGERRPGAPAAPAYKEEPDLKADCNMVFDLMHELKLTFEHFVNGDKQNVPYVDAMMGVHNFHKLIIKDIAERANMPAPARWGFYRMTADTYSKAMDDMIEKERQRA